MYIGHIFRVLHSVCVWRGKAYLAFLFYVLPQLKYVLPRDNVKCIYSRIRKCILTSSILKRIWGKTWNIVDILAPF